MSFPIASRYKFETICESPAFTVDGKPIVHADESTRQQFYAEAALALNCHEPLREALANAAMRLVHAGVPPESLRAYDELLIASKT